MRPELANKTCKRGHVGMYDDTGRCAQCHIERKRERVRLAREGKPPEKRKAATYHGKTCSIHGTTERYVSNGCCLQCTSTKRAVEDPSQMVFPTRTIRIERPLRLPLLLEIPAPPPALVNRPWLVAKA